MAFASAISKTSVFGNLRMACGTYTNDGGSTGGDINAGMSKVIAMTIQPGGASVDAAHPVINETLPCDGSAVTIVTTANVSGTWIAFGN